MSKTYLFIFNAFAKQYFFKRKTTLAVTTKSLCNYFDIYILNWHLKGSLMSSQD